MNTPIEQNPNLPLGDHALHNADLASNFRAADLASLVDGAIGTAVGTGVGVIGALMIVSGGITLFIASPVVAPLAMLGWFASVGGVIGTMVGANNKTKGKFSELVMDAVEAGNAVLIVQTHNEADTQLAKDIINLSLKGTDEVAAVDPI